MTDAYTVSEYTPGSNLWLVHSPERIAYPSEPFKSEQMARDVAESLTTARRNRERWAGLLSPPLEMGS